MKTANTRNYSRSLKIGKVSVQLVQHFSLRVLTGTLFALGLSSFALGQNYLTNTGVPPSLTKAPAEMGFVDTSSGNLHLEIPLGSLPQRGGSKPLVPKLIYDSHIWAYPTDGSAMVWTPRTNLFPEDFGSWGLVEGGTTSLTVPSYNGNNGCNRDFRLLDGAGTQRYFVLPGARTGSVCDAASAYAVDGSGYLLNVPSCAGCGVFSTTGATVYAPDGTLVGGGSGSGRVDAAKDSNGNRLSLSFPGVDPGINSPVIDTLGRKPALPAYSSDPTITYLEVPNSQGGLSQYTVHKATIALKTAFGQSGIAECVTNCTVEVIQSLALPDGSQYSFYYDCDSTLNSAACNSPTAQSAYYGTLTKMILPTGQAITYGYITWQDTQYNNSRWLTSKSGGGNWSYSPVGITRLNGLPGTQKVTVTRPDGSSSITFYRTWNGVWPYEIDEYDTDSVTLLSQVMDTWDFSNTCQLHECFGGYQDVHLLKSVTTVPIPGGSITKQTTYSYDSPATGNITAVKEWKYQNGTSPTFSTIPDRATYTAYIPSNQFAAPNTTNKPFTIFVCTSAGTSDPYACPDGGALVSGRSFTYDNYGPSYGNLPLQSVTGVVNHDDGNYGTSLILRGNLTNIGFFVSSSDYWLGSNMSYDTTGQVIQTTDLTTSLSNTSIGHATNLSYADKFFSDNGVDPASPYSPATPTNAYPTKATDAVGSVSKAYYFGSGKPASATDYNGITSYSHYMDVDDRPTQTDYAIGWSLSTYTSPTQLDSYSPISAATASVACTSCTHTQATLDSLGRIQAGTFINNPAGAVTVNHSYDGLNRIASSSHPHIGTGDPNNVTEIPYYDGLGRSLEVRHADGQTASSAYGADVGRLGGLATQQGSAATYGVGFPVVSVDEAGNHKQSWVDGFGRVIEVDEPNGTGGLSSPVVTLYKYDVLGNLVEVDQGAQTRTYQYDGLSRLTQKSTPEGGTETLSYVTTGGTVCSGVAENPCKRTDGRGIATTYSYDSANRLTGKVHSATTPATGSETYIYGTSAGNFNIGRLRQMTDSSGSETYFYDKMGRVTEVAKVVGSTTYNTLYQYNAGGQMTKLTYPSGRVVQYTYDNVGHLCAVGPSGGCNSSTSYLKLQSSAYDAASRALSATYGNGVVVTAAYSPNRSQLTSLSYAKGTATLFGLHYYYQQDATNCPSGNSIGDNGQIQCIADAVQVGRSVSYTYDSLTRLNTASIRGSTSYPAWGVAELYDRYANRSGQSVSVGSAPSLSLGIDPATNRITGFTYDASGNVTGVPTPNAATFTYDGEGCNTGFTGNGSSATYACDGNNLRVKKVVTGTNAATTVYIYSRGQVIAEYDGAAAVTSPTREEIYSHDLLATVTGSTGGIGGTIVYLHRDRYSARLYTDANGNNVGEEGTFPFGEPWYQNGTVSNWVFGTYEHDKESGLEYALARSYASNLGRFQSPDPLNGKVSDPQSWNRYAYSRNDPVNLDDPSGQGFWGDLWGDFVGLFGVSDNAADKSGQSGNVDPNVGTYNSYPNPNYDPNAPASSDAADKFIIAKHPPEYPYWAVGDNSSEWNPMTTLEVSPFHNIVFQVGGTKGIFSPSLSYVPATGNIYQSFFSVGTPAEPGGYIAGGYTSNEDLSGWGYGASGFGGPGAGPGGVVGYSGDNPGDIMVLGGVGTPGAGAGGGYTDLIGSIPPAGFTVPVPAIPPGVTAIPIGDGWYTWNVYPTQ